MEIFDTILYYINTFFIAMCTLAFFPQVMYILLCFVKEKKYSKAKENHKCAIIVPAHNEEEVIKVLLQSLIQQNYPKDCYDVFVVAHNCTDKTAEIAGNMGINVIVRDEASENNVGYALKYGINYILENYPNKYEFFLRYDADGLVHPDAVTKFNDAFESGVRIGKGYNNTKNMNASLVAGVSSVYFIRDNRFSCHVRNRISGAQILIGTQMMISTDLLIKIGGWDCYNIVEDAEFGVKRLLEGERIDYVPLAQVYDEHPATVADSMKRYTRVGHGLFRLFFKDGFKLLGKFFTTFKWRYLDNFLTLLFIPIAVVACTWFPLYYGYVVVYNAIIGNMPAVYNVLMTIGWVLLFGLITMFIAQGILAVILEKKRVVQTSKSKLFLSVIFQPIYMIVYAISITLGVFEIKPKWRKIKRTKPDKELLEYLNIVDEDADESIVSHGIDIDLAGVLVLADVDSDESRIIDVTESEIEVVAVSNSLDIDKTDEKINNGSVDDKELEEKREDVIEQ